MPSSVKIWMRPSSMNSDKRADRAGILVLEEAPSRGREDDDRPAGMAVALVFHRPAEMAAVFLVVGNMHLASGLFGVDEAHGVAEFVQVLRPHLIGVVAHGAAEYVFDRGCGA